MCAIKFVQRGVKMMRLRRNLVEIYFDKSLVRFVIVVNYYFARFTCDLMNVQTHCTKCGDNSRLTKQSLQAAFGITTFIEYNQFIASVTSHSNLNAN